jgi:hypothetical protein
MTKKHFIALADYIKWHNNEARAFPHTHKPFKPSHLDTLMKFCRSQNGNFSNGRFLGYIAGECGSNGGAIKPPSKPRYITPERKLARRLEGK